MTGDPKRGSAGARSGSARQSAAGSHADSHAADHAALPPYAGRHCSEPIPKVHIPDQPMPAAGAYQLIHDELALDGNAAMNLASFVTTWMEPEAERLVHDVLSKNLIDQDEYPQTFQMEERVTTMLASLFHSPHPERPDPEKGRLEGSWGTIAVGSSEAVMLGLLAHKWSWREKRGFKTGEGPVPNVVMGADVHTVFEKFCRYFDVEARIAPLAADDFILTADKARPLIDENTCAVVGVAGTTFTGQMDDIEGIHDLLVELEREKGWDIPLHVDGASGGFILPFVDFAGKKEPKWDFRLPKVRSINVSNHKFGLVYPGLGSIIFRDASDVPKDLPFQIDYLGSPMANYSLNFSRGSAMVLAQYYNFLRLGMEGYRRTVRNCMENARYLTGELERMGFTALHDGDLFPVVVVRTPDGGPEPHVLVDDLRRRGWIIPAYPLKADPEAPAKPDDIVVLRMVIRANVTRDMCSLLVADMANSLKRLASAPPPPADVKNEVLRHRFPC